jgi:HSP20 family molecular chaperone IbpA
LQNKISAHWQILMLKRCAVRTRDRGYTRVERKIGRFIRRFKLPDNIDADNINAKVRCCQQPLAAARHQQAVKQS